jgi:hypothetical protein
MEHDTDAQLVAKLFADRKNRVAYAYSRLLPTEILAVCAVFMYVGQWSTATGAAAPRGELILSTTVSRPGVTKYVTPYEIIQTEFWRYQCIINPL